MGLNEDGSFEHEGRGTWPALGGVLGISKDAARQKCRYKAGQFKDKGFQVKNGKLSLTAAQMEILRAARRQPQGRDAEHVGAAQDYMTVKEGAAYLRVDRKTIDKMIADGTIHVLRQGKRVIRIHRAELEQLGRRNAKEPVGFSFKEKSNMTKLESAKKLIRVVLSDVPVMASELARKAKSAGIASRTLTLARQGMGIEKTFKNRRWWLSIPAQGTGGGESPVRETRTQSQPKTLEVVLSFDAPETLLVKGMLAGWHDRRTAAETALGPFSIVLSPRRTVNDLFKRVVLEWVESCTSR